jgi:hypothetical protein
MSTGGCRPLSGTESTWIGVHQKTNKMTSEIDFLSVLSQAFKADALLRKGPTDDPHAALPADIAAGTDAPSGPVLRITKFGQNRTVGAAAFVIEGRGHLLAQSLMRPLGVVVVNPTIGSALLASWCARRRRGDFGFVNSMHLFMRGVILGAGATSELDSDAEAQPPSRESRQVQRSIAGEGRTVIDADDLRLAIAKKKMLKILSHRLVAVPEQANAQDITTEQIAHRQRIDSLTIAGAKPSFEVDSPDTVGALRHRQGWPRQLRSAARSSQTPRHSHQARQPLGDRPHSGQACSGMISAQAGVDLLGAPMRMFETNLSDRPQPFGSCASTQMNGTMRALGQSQAAFLAKTLEPFETGFAADSELTAALRNGLNTSQGLSNKALSRFQ